MQGSKTSLKSVIKAVEAWWLSMASVPPVAFLILTLKNFGEDNGSFYSAGLSFFLLLTFAPMILLGVSLLGFFVDPHSASHYVQNMVMNLLPSGGARMEATHLLTQRLNVDQQVHQVVKDRGIAGIVAFFSLLWTSLQIFLNASVAMNAMWEVKESRNWFFLRGLAILLILVSGVLITLTLLLSGAPSAIAHFDYPVIHRLRCPFVLLTILLELVAVVVNAVMYVVMYKLLPSARVSWRAAIVGGVSASVMWEVAKKGIASWILSANHSIYGDLANLILFVLWIYYSMMIFLLGAELSATYAKRYERGNAGTSTIRFHRTTKNNPRTESRGRHIKRPSRSPRGSASFE